MAQTIFEIDEIETIRERVQVYSTRRGYTIVNPQLSLFAEEAENLTWLFDLASSATPFKPQVRIFWAQDSLNQINQRTFNAIRATITDKSIGLIAFTDDGLRFICIATDSNSRGFLSFIPRIIDTYQQIRSIEDLKPFLSIYELRQIVNRLSDAIFSLHGHDRLKLFDALLLLIATKIYDEIENPTSLQLPIIIEFEDEKFLAAFQKMTLHALDKLGCCKFESRLSLDASILKANVLELMPFSLKLTVDIGTQTEVLSTFYQEIVSSTFRGSLGAYFTPKPLADFAASLYNSSENDSILDMSCGSGAFLLSTFSQINNPANENNLAPVLFGCDIQERMALTTVINCFLQGINNDHIIDGDALKIDLSSWHEIDPAVPVDGFSLIVGNPPFAGFESSQSLPGEMQNLSASRKGVRVNKIIPFITKTVQLLRPGGRAILVIPISVLNGEATPFKRLREWLTTQVEMNTIIGVPREAFVHTDCGIVGAIIQFTKKYRPNANANVFFRNLENVGYDRRGNPIAGSQLNETIEMWRNPAISKEKWITLDDLYHSDRWDATWLEGHRHFHPSNFLKGGSASLTSLCEIAKRTLPKKEIQPEKTYFYFELGDTHIDTGAIMNTHPILGKDLHTKSRLQVPVLYGDILLPNHRDSLIAKTATRTGRSAVFVEEQFSGLITSNRYTVLRSTIDPRLLIFILNSDFVREQLALLARGSASVDIRDKVLTQVKVPTDLITNSDFQRQILETIEERQRLQGLLNQADTKIDLLMAEMAKSI